MTVWPFRRADPSQRAPLLSDATRARLDRFVRAEYSCDPGLARSGGVHVVSAAERTRPAWHGYFIPMVGLSFPMGAAIAARPDLFERLLTEMGSDAHREALDWAALKRLHRAMNRLGSYAFSLAGDLRAADASTFEPSPTEQRAELVPRDDAGTSFLRARFDGEIFGVRGPHGRVVAWTAIKIKSPEVGELAVATEPNYRGRGFARDTVSAATRQILERGSTALYIHDHDNGTSAYVARSLGFVRYSELAFVEV